MPRKKKYSSSESEEDLSCSSDELDDAETCSDEDNNSIDNDDHDDDVGVNMDNIKIDTDFDSILNADDDDDDCPFKLVKTELSEGEDIVRYANVLEREDQDDDPFGELGVICDNVTADEIIIKQEPVDEANYQHVCFVCDGRFFSSEDLQFHSQFCRYDGRASERRSRVRHKLERRRKRKEELITRNGRFSPDIISRPAAKSTAKGSQSKAKSTNSRSKSTKSATKKSSSKSIKSKTTVVESASASRQMKNRSTKEVICPVCEASVGSQSHLRDHMRKHTGEKPFECDTCGKHFVTLPVLRRHAKEHAAYKPYTCSTCNKSFAAESNLIGHMRVHERKHSVVCAHCGKAYRNHTDLVVHERSHTGERPFICSVCGKAFVTNMVLKRHKRVHAEHKPFSCPVCDKAFAAEVDVRSHLRGHPIKDLPLTCYFCQHECANTDDLVEHMETHNLGKKKELECDVCGLVSRNHGEFVIHQRRHTGEKPFSCSTCGKCFVSNVLLRKHMRRHSDFKPYECEVCSKRFAAMADKNTHIKSHSAKQLQERLIRLNKELLGEDYEGNQVETETQSNTSNSKQAKLLACTFCGKESTSESSLRKHEKTHLKGKYKTCSGCGKICETEITLQKHESVCSRLTSVTEDLQMAFHVQPSSSDDYQQSFEDQNIHQACSSEFDIPFALTSLTND